MLCGLKWMLKSYIVSTHAQTASTGERRGEAGGPVRPLPSSSRPSRCLSYGGQLPLRFLSGIFALLQAAVDLVQGLFDAQSRQPCRGVLVPALFHELDQSRERLREADERGGGAAREVMSESETDTHRVREPAVGNERPLLLHTHHLPHVLKARVIRHLVVERRLVLLHDA